LSHATHRSNISQTALVVPVGHERHDIMYSHSSSIILACMSVHALAMLCRYIPASFISRTENDCHFLTSKGLDASKNIGITNHSQGFIIQALSIVHSDFMPQRSMNPLFDLFSVPSICSAREIIRTSVLSRFFSV
jgi:hypothetical protein